MVKCQGYDADVADNLPWIDISGVHDEAAGTLTLFAVNRHASEDLALDLSLQGLGNASVTDHQAMTDALLAAVNTATDQTTVVPHKGKGARVAEDRLQASLKPYPDTMIGLKLG